MCFSSKHDPVVTISANALLSCLIVFAVAVCWPHLVLAQDGIEGIWINETGKGAVQILSCDDADNFAHSATASTTLCGYIVWINPDKDEYGQPLRDTLNEDAEKRTRFICGMQIIGQLKYQTDGGWDQGWIYDPRRGKSFDLAMRLLSKDRLKVTGYLKAKFLGKSFVWQRALQGIETCLK